MTAYFDCNATTPVDPRVIEVMQQVLSEQWGNAGSPHAIGRQAKAAVSCARDQVGVVVAARRHEVVFTSGATESNNLAILGLAAYGQKTGRRHIVSSQIEHKAVLEPLLNLQERGFSVSLVPPQMDGRVRAEDVLAAVHHDTLLVSLMHANNETGVLQPISAVAEGLQDRDVYLHVDAAQGFGKQIDPLRHPRIDLISISGHKIYGPQGVGALITRRRGFDLPPLEALTLGGGQELGLRPGTLPVHLIVALGKAAELALAEHADRADRCAQLREKLLPALGRLNPQIHGDPEYTQSHVLNLSFPGVPADLAMEFLDPLIAVSNGSACTTICDSASHVLKAMQVDAGTSDGALRFSWHHDSELPNLDAIVAIIRELQMNPPTGQSPIAPRS